MSHTAPDLPRLLESLFAFAPTRPAVFQNGNWRDWGWMQGVMRTVGSLLSQQDIAPDRPVAVIPRNRPSSAAALLGLLQAGRSVSMIYVYQSAASIAEEVRKLAPSAILADVQDWSPELEAAARETGSGGIALADDGAAPASLIMPRNPAKAENHHPPFAVSGVEMLTSGTTGKPKRYLIPATLIARSMILESTVPTAGSGPDAPLPDPMINPYPFGNISGLYTLLPLVCAGVPVLMQEKFDIDAWLEFVEQYRPKVMSLPPPGLFQVLERNVPPERLSSLVYLTSGAARIDPAQHDAFEERYGIPVVCGYGATEFGGPVANMTYDLRQQFGPSKRHTVGRAWAGADLRVIDEETSAILPPGTPGLLEVMAPRIGTEWIRTTDIGSIDADGFLTIHGRADGAISRGGFKIMPDTIVDAMLKHPAVGRAAAVGLPDQRLGQVPAAAIVLRPGMTATVEELRAHARANLYATHVPARFAIVDAIPLTPSLKVSLPGLAALFAKDDEQAA